MLNINHVGLIRNIKSDNVQSDIFNDVIEKSLQARESVGILMSTVSGSATFCFPRHFISTLIPFVFYNNNGVSVQKAKRADASVLLICS